MGSATNKLSAAAAARELRGRLLVRKRQVLLASLTRNGIEDVLLSICPGFRVHARQGTSHACPKATQTRAVCAAVLRGLDRLIASPTNATNKASADAGPRVEVDLLSNADDALRVSVADLLDSRDQELLAVILAGPQQDTPVDAEPEPADALAGAMTARFRAAA